MAFGSPLAMALGGLRLESFRLADLCKIVLNMRPYFIDGLAGINHAETLRFRLCQVKKRLSCTTLEIVSCRFHAIFIML